MVAPFAMQMEGMAPTPAAPEPVVKSMVMDALGKFNSLTKDTFDMQAVLNPLSDKMDISALLELPFATVFDTIFLGKNPALVGRWKESLMKYLKTVGRTTGKLAIGELSSIIGGVPGLVASEILTSVLEVALDLFAQEERPVAWTPGMWVVIDLEHKVHDSKDLVRKEDWAQLEMFGDFDTLAEHRDIEREDYGLGIYADAGAVPGTHMVFNFKAKRYEQRKTAVVRPLSKVESDKLDSDPHYAMIREIFMLQHSDPTHLDSSVNLDPGAEVIYSGELYSVIKSVGSHVIIEDLSGRRVRCSIEDLKRGRTVRSGALHYGGEETPGYHDQNVMAGDYVWLPATIENQKTSPGCQVALCVVAYFHGERVITYECFNGQKQIVDEHRLQMLTPEYNNLVSNIKQFQKFRKFAVENNSNLQTWAVGAPFVEICYGNAEGNRIRYFERDMPAKGEFEETEPVRLETAGNIVEGGNVQVGDKPDPVEIVNQDTQTGYMIMGAVGVAVALAIFSLYD